MPDLPERSSVDLESSLLQRVQVELRRAALEPLSHARFLETHDAFESSSSQRRQIAQWFGRRAYARPPVDILSIGSGGGDLDLSILDALSRDGASCRYLGVDPNPVECRRCRQTLEQLPEQVQVRVEAASFERMELDPGSFDVVYAVHTLYYLGDVGSALDKSLGLLREGGELVVFQAPRGRLNRLSALSWEAQLRRKVEFSEDLREDLRGLDWECSRVEGAIDVTPCVRDKHSPRAVALRDFILQVDSSRLGPECTDAVDDYLRAIATADGDQWLAPHPVDAFVIRPGAGLTG